MDSDIVKPMSYGNISYVHGENNVTCNVRYVYCNILSSTFGILHLWLQ